MTASCLPSAVVCGLWRPRAQYCHPSGLESLICSLGEGMGQCEKPWEELGRAVIWIEGCSRSFVWREWLWEGTGPGKTTSDGLIRGSGALG